MKLSQIVTLEKVRKVNSSSSFLGAHKPPRVALLFNLGSLSGHSLMAHWLGLTLSLVCPQQARALRCFLGEKCAQTSC